METNIETNIVIENLNKYYGKKQVLKNINLTINQGMFGLLGRNGAGKTTLMKILSTLLYANEGKITIGDIPIHKSKEIRKLIGYLPQDFSMYGNMIVYEAMDYLGVLSGMSKSERKETIPELLRKVNLYAYKDIRVKTMSGGMLRRLGIAQALLHNPKILIVDEPTAGLDPEERVRFRNLLSEMAEDRIVILSTHIVGDIEATCEKIAVLDAGEMIFNGSIDELLLVANSKIYTANISKIELEELKQNYIVTSMITTGNMIHVRFISEGIPFDNAEKVDANVEDAYICLINKYGERGEM